MVLVVGAGVAGRIASSADHQRATPTRPEPVVPAAASSDSAHSADLPTDPLSPQQRTSIAKPDSKPGQEQSAVPPKPPRDTESEWLAETRDLSPDQIEDLRRSIRDDIVAQTNDWFATALEVGPYDVIGHGTRAGGKDWDQTVIMRVRMPPDEAGEIRKAVLPESQYPELYLLHRKWRWLETRADDVRRAMHAAAATGAR